MAHLELCRAFAGGRPEPGTSDALEAIDEESLEGALDRLFRRATPEGDVFALGAASFARHVGQVLGMCNDPLAELERLHAADLYLAAACARSSAAAVQTFEARYGAEIEAGLERYRDALRRDDFLQSLRHKLFVGDETRPPAIATYQGRGALRYWVKITTARSVRDAMRRRQVRKREVAVESQTIDALLAPTTDPELEYLKAHYRAEFRDALVHSLARLDARQRNLLRYSLTDGLSIDEIGTVYGVHRATAARWLNRARDVFVEEVGSQMQAQLGVRPSEMQSIFRMIRSRVDLDVGKML